MYTATLNLQDISEHRVSLDPKLEKLESASTELEEPGSLDGGGVHAKD